MLKNKLALSVGLALGSLAVSSSAFATSTYFDARNNAMGGVGVASSHYGVAALVNPALVAKDDKVTDDFSLVLPSIGIQGSDKDNLIDGIDDLSDTYDRFDEAIKREDNSAIADNADELEKELRAIDGKYVDANIGVNIVATLPTRWGSASLFANGYGTVAISSHVADSDFILLETIANNPELLPDGYELELQSEARAVAALVQDYGLAVAKIVEIQGLPVHFGVTPKLQKVDTFNYRTSVDNFETDDIDDSRYRDSETGFNADLGIAVDYSQLTFGLSARNIISRDIETKEVEGKKYTYQIAPLVTTGVAYRGDIVTLGADIDLTETKGFSHMQSSQYAGVGAELSAWGWAQLRAGYRADIKGDMPNMVTAGLGLSPFKVVHLDLAGFMGSDEAVGAAVTMSYTF
ncbi:hypothetical protein CBP31_00635 [Oceanisphaera profunda]|uniref:Conjugal transfer protein TraF n=1 Tax=Oceanisphaera profunda TaxID=1416627 RepID=A0A1Y0D1C2_9GAMM|nr:conjugal transfer protein TraF [Oceanisphaera profunda]ART81322.1 hypothetical protein CBP31_00635 [Oceanisphaera profunda]